MKFLLVSLNFAPELTGIGRYNGEMVDWLVAQGQEVRVICAPPYYPEWRVASGYRAYGYRTERAPGVVVIRCPTFVPKRPTGLRRVLHLISFGVSAAPVILWNALRWRPDTVFLTMPPLVCVPAVIIATKVAGARSWMHVQDFEVDAAFDLGLVRGPRVRRGVLGLERTLLRGFDRITTISSRMRDRLIAKGVDAGKTGLFPNWADLARIAPATGISPYRAELGISASTCVCLYAGSWGVKQGLDLLVEAVLLLSEDLDLVLVLCGDGPARPQIESLTAGQRRVRTLPLQPVERLNDLLAMADIQVLPQRAEAQDLVMPSKLPNMMASGRVVLACAAEGSEISAVLEGVGCVVPPGNAAALAVAIDALAKDPAQRHRLGDLGQARARRLWDRDAVLADALGPPRS